MGAWAARPFVTDDARLTTAGSCQLETWMRSYPGSREYWALPACNPSGNLEFTLGGGLADGNGQATTTDQVLQLKTLLRALENDGWGVGIALGAVRHPEIQPGPNQLGNTYAYVPYSASFAGGRRVLHVNLGWLRDHATWQDRLTWGVGAEFAAVYPRLTWIAEAFGDQANRPYGQVGLRYSVRPDLLQIDATVGQQAAGDSAARWLSLGLRWTPPRLF